MLIVLDRDGVINKDSPHFIKSPDEWIPIPGSLEAIARLKQAGHTVVVATNQSGVGRGLYTLDTLAAIHQKMLAALQAVGASLDGIYYCPHHPDEGCDCRKPKAGMMHQIARDFNPNWPDAMLVGDSLRDLQSAAAVGCPATLVLTGKGQETLAALPSAHSFAVSPALASVIF